MEIRPIPGLPNYGATRSGRIFRLRDIGRAKAGELTQHAAKRGYLVVTFDRKFYTVHRLVALAYIPNPENKPIAAHNNGKKHQNRVSNLRWATQKENSDDMPIHGTLPFGEAAPCVKLKLAEVREIQKLTVGKTPRAKPYHRDIAKRFGITRECVTRIANQNRWIRAAA